MEIVPNLEEMEQLQYMRRKAEEEAKKSSVNEFSDVKNFMMTTQIQCFKYNSSLDKAVQKVNCYDAFISLSADGKELIVTKRVPVSEAMQVVDTEPDRYNDYDDEIDITPERRQEKDSTKDEEKKDGEDHCNGQNLFHQLEQQE